MNRRIFNSGLIALWLSKHRRQSKFWPNIFGGGLAPSGPWYPPPMRCIICITFPVDCGIIFLLRSVNIILFTLLFHLILRISPHLRPQLGSHGHHLSLPRPFTPELENLELISCTNPSLHSGSIWTFADLEPDQVAFVCFSLFLFWLRVLY